jgi:hypothetical protein
MGTLDELKLVKRRNSADLLRRPGVCGVDIETDPLGNAVLTVHLETDDPKVRKTLPDKIEGHAVKYVHTGPFQKL